MEDTELLRLMEKCGHFLYHRRGGKRGQMRILMLLKEKNSIPQKELPDLLSLKSGSVSETVSKLEAHGLIVRERDLTDKRRINITLTSEGDAYIKEREQKRQLQDSVLFTSLTKDEIKQLTKLLSKLTADWEDKFDSSLFNHRR
jgi:DNA-binding MarR family transcriptional regulator